MRRSSAAYEIGQMGLRHGHDQSCSEVGRHDISVGPIDRVFTSGDGVCHQYLAGGWRHCGHAVLPGGGRWMGPDCHADRIVDVQAGSTYAAALMGHLSCIRTGQHRPRQIVECEGGAR